MNYYIAGIVREDDGSGYSVYFPDIPTVAAGGESVEEAISNAADGLYVALRSMAELGQAIPAPSALEVVKKAVSAEREQDGLSCPADTVWQFFPAQALDMVPVRINMTIPRGVLAEIDAKAKLAGMTRSGYMTAAAQAYAHS